MANHHQIKNDPIQKDKMRLKDINIRLEKIKTTLRPGCVEDLYLKNLKKIDTDGVAKINIYLSRDQQFKIEAFASNTLSCSIFFDEEKFFATKDNREKKQQLLDKLLEALSKCAEQNKWSQDPFLDAYNECIKKDLKNEWWFKNRFFNSKDNKYSVGLYNIYDIDSFVVYLVVFDMDQNELGRRIVFKDDFQTFHLETAAWEGNSIFTFKFKPPKKVFKVKIDDVVSQLPYFIPKKTSDWFK